MTPAQVALGIALKCLPPALAPVAAGIALHENPALNARAVHHNPNGTDDFGLGQVNGVHFGWLSQSMHTPVNAQTILNPCINMQALMRVYFKKYNGNPPPEVAAAYAEAGIVSAGGVIDQTAKLPPVPGQSAPEPVSPFSRPGRNAPRDISNRG